MPTTTSLTQVIGPLKNARNTLLTCASCRPAAFRNHNQHNVSIAFAVFTRSISSPPNTNRNPTQTKSKLGKVAAPVIPKHKTATTATSSTPPVAPNTIDTTHTRPGAPGEANHSLKSTRPAILESIDPAIREPNGSVTIPNRFKFLFRLGKSYLAFYKTGMKNIWYNYKEMKLINRRLGRYDLRAAAKYGGQQDFPHDSFVQVLPDISRREFQLCLRTMHDLRLLIPFGLIFAVFGEFTPLVILAIGSAVVPYTCRIPKQQMKDWMYQSHVWSNFYAEMNKLQSQSSETSTPTSVPTPTTSTTQQSPISPPANDWRHDFLMAHYLRLTPFSTPIPIIGQLYTTLILTPRLRAHYKDVFADTVLIHREGGFSKLNPDEILLYAQNYGLFSLPFIYRKLGVMDHDDKTKLVEEGWRPDEKLKNELVPILEKEAKQMLNAGGVVTSKSTDKKQSKQPAGSTSTSIGIKETATDPDTSSASDDDQWQIVKNMRRFDASYDSKVMRDYLKQDMGKDLTEGKH